MTAEEYFSETRQVARTKFLSTCLRLRMRPSPFGPPADPLVDCLRLGNPGAKRLLVVCGGDRTADALCCSAIEIGWLRQFGKASLPSDSAMVLLHHGPAPATGGEMPAKGSPPPEWQDDILARVEQRYAEYAKLQGIDSTGAPLGASTDGDVAGYPGKLLDDLAEEMAPTPPERVVFLEIRVGAGPWGQAEITPCHHPGTAAEKRVRGWFSLPDPSEDAIIQDRGLDSLGAGLQRRFPKALLSAATASFGTYSMQSVLELLAARPEGKAVPATGRLAYPDDAPWREAVWQSAVVTIQRALTGIYAR